MATVELRNLVWRRPGRDPSPPFNLRLGDGEMMTLLGPAAATKSLLLRVVAGVEPPVSGSVLIGAVKVEHLPPRERDIAMMFSTGSVDPDKTVRANIEMPLRARRVGRAARQEATQYTAHLLQLEDQLAIRSSRLDPETQQRVALARALVRNPRLLLLDDPFAGLTRRPRDRLRTLLRALQRQMRVTTLLASDDSEEAMYLSDRIAVLRDDTLLQVDTPANLYARPATALVAALLGAPPMNLFSADYADGVIAIADQRLRAPETWRALLGDDTALLVGVRPENFELGGPAHNRLGVILDPTSRVVLGSRILLQGHVGDHVATIELPAATGDLPRHAYTSLEQAHLFSRDSGERLLS